jgi:sporulation protein YlmC with PRC-barrel domain
VSGVVAARRRCPNRKKVAMSDTRTTAEWTGRQVVDTMGEKIGSVQDVFYDDAMDQPEWLMVKMGLFGQKRVFVPAQDVRTDGERLMVPYTEDRVKEAPQVAKGGESLSRDEERELYIYYGIEYPEPTVTMGSQMGSTMNPEPEVTEAAQRERETVETGSRDR